MKNAVYCGSFNPVTKGHVNIIERAARLCDETLFVAVAYNAEKVYKVPLQMRLELLQNATTHIKNVVCVAVSGAVADFCVKNGVSVIIKSGRNALDIQSEMDMAEINQVLCGAETVYLSADPKLRAVSSSVVRELAALGKNVKGLVPEGLEKKISELYK